MTLFYGDLVKPGVTEIDTDFYIGWDVECAACYRKFERGDRAFVVVTDRKFPLVCALSESFLPGAHERISCLDRLIGRKFRRNHQDYLSEVLCREVIFIGFVDFCEDSMFDSC